MLIGLLGLRLMPHLFLQIFKKHLCLGKDYYSFASSLFLCHMTKSIIIYCLRLSIYLTNLYHFNYFLSHSLKNIFNFMTILGWCFIISKSMTFCEFLCLLTCYLSPLLLYKYCSLRSYLLPITTVCILSWELFLT